MPKLSLFYLGLLVWVMPLASDGVIFYSTGDPSYNSTAPTGDLEGSGWQFQGTFNSYLGTPIAPHHFITAHHIGGSVGNKFYYDGQVYTTTGYVDDSESDLRLWEVDGTFERYAPVYSGSSEVGKGLVVFGRGVDRGVVVTNTITSGRGPSQTTEAMTNGWRWGGYNYTQRWGTNVVAAVAAVSGYSTLQIDWDAGAGADECMLADKDSGGAVFIRDGDTWKLAGINYAIGPAWTYSFNSDGSDSFNGAILDFQGDNPLYVNSGGSWVQVPSTYKSSFYSSRISSRYSWITNNIPDFDRDVDGLPDWWEMQYAGDSTSMESGADPDADGFSNDQEWIADTVPTNGASFFEMGFPSGVTQLVFTSSTGRSYQVEYRLDLADTNDTWQTEVEWFSGSPSQTVTTVTVPVSNRFYRVDIRLN